MSSAQATPTLTPAERRRLVEAFQQIAVGHLSAQWGLVRKGLARASLERTCQRLCQKGLLKPYVHGGLEVTEAGRQAVAGQGAPS